MSDDQNSEEENMHEDSDDSDSDDTTEQDEARVRELEKEISKNPYLYNSHMELIEKLRAMGDLPRLRAARQAMQKCFPLSEDLWTQWIRDEIPLMSEDGDRAQVEALFELAVKDYVSVTVWLEYVQFAIGGMGAEGGVQRVREVFERAITAVGLHVPLGATVWEAYREFENALLAGLMPQPGAVTTKEQEEAFSAQHHKIASLFKRQLAVPLMDMEETYGEYKEWQGGTVDEDIQKSYDRALDLLKKVKPFEQQLVHAEAPRLAEYQSYLEYELSQGDPARIQCLFERALLDNCLVPELWIQYTKYLDEQLKIASISMEVYDRALRNCPWSGSLWRNYILTLERNSQPFETIKGTMDKALTAGFTDASDYLQVWTVYCDYLRRRINWTKDHEQELETFRLTIERAADHLFENFGLDGDPEASLRQHWASIEVRYCNNLEQARQLWNQMMQEGYGSQAAMWLSYYRLERTFGDAKHCRRILQRAVNSVTDWPEAVTKVYIDFEREEGTLEDYEAAYSKCEAQLARVNQRKAKAAEKEAAMKEQKKKQRVAAKEQKKIEKPVDQGDTSTAQPGSKQNSSGKWSEAVTGAHSYQDRSRKRKVTEDTANGDGFKMPMAPDGDVAPPAKRSREDEPNDHGQTVQHDASKDNVTIFVSNLDYSTTEDRVQEALKSCGDIVEVRLVKNYKGLSKGFGYVQFSDPNGVLAALKQDRVQVDGRPMFVSRCEDRSAGKKTHNFKYSTAMEKSKLFVKNLPFTCSAEALKNIFSQHGKVKDVRLVTYRNGASKGLAYVEYETEEMATHAVLKTDGLQIGDHMISVAISNPPQRKQPFGSAPPVPSLGGGKKETEIRGKARTQVSLVPRSVQRPGATPSQKPAAPGGSTPTPSSSGEGSGSGTKSKMSNDDFRKLLLK